MIDALRIHVKGVVQGVGFRPFVYRMAKKHLITGWVMNTAEGVDIHAEGESQLVDAFVLAVHNEAPAAAKVKEMTMTEVPLEQLEGFEIRESEQGAGEEITLVSPDLATCDDCVRELFDPADRRYRYPFINCTNCGPRFTIIDELPYDRPRTSMATFEMCPDCAAEYADPADRRFHAQPDACPVCGPQLTWYEKGGDEEGSAMSSTDDLFAKAADVLVAGGILAVKGLGGFHLVCDANNADAVQELRVRKHRFGKAFAVMMSSTAAVQQVCEMSAEEQKVLTSPARPIVLLKKHSDAGLVLQLADGLPELGVMLPYTPVQHILLHDFAEAIANRGDRMPPMLVMTSGNMHDEPIVTSDEEAIAKLLDGGIADAVLGNDRPILSRYDDSVVRLVSAGSSGAAIQIVRRARGYCPVPLPVDQQSGDVLFAAGPEQKNTCCLTRNGQAFVSQHVGDMENAETYDAWLEAKGRLEKLFQVKPTRLACDMHPEYLSTKWAREQDLPCVEVQHHHAHIASVLGEYGLTDAVCGIAFDGTGYGVDGAIWGGETLVANQQAFERFANFAYVPMPGGAAAVKHPLRMAYGVLWAFDLLDHPQAQAALEKLDVPQSLLEQMIDREINTPMTSSVGRLFDAASALLGICVEPTYEGQPAIMLEAAMGQTCANGKAGMASIKRCPERAEQSSELSEHAQDRPGDWKSHQSPYQINVLKNTATEDSTAQDTSVVLFDAEPAFRALLDDLAAGVPVGEIARRFHDAFVQAIVQMAQLTNMVYGITTVVLSGGVFMNRYLLEHSLLELSEAGFTVAMNRDLPPNDGCISFGQTVVALAAGK